MPPTNKRATISRDSVFRRPESVQTPAVRQGITEAAPLARQTGVWLVDDETDWIDDCCRGIRKGGWRGITRSAFIRSLIQAAKTKQFDLTGVSGEIELTEALKKAI
jgi:hypothetical protein